MIITIGAYVKGQLDNVAKEENFLLVESVKNIFNHDLIIFQANIRELSISKEVLNFFEDQSPESAIALDNYVRINTDKLNDLEFFYLMDTDGLTIYSTDDRLMYNNYSFREYFTNAIEGNVSTTAAIGVTTGEAGFYFSSPVYKNDINKELIGVAVIKFNPSIFFNDLFGGSNDELVPSKINTEVSIVSRQGLVLISNTKENEFKFLGDVPSEIIKQVRERKILDGIEEEFLPYDLAVNYVIDNSVDKIQITDSFDPSHFITIDDIEDFPYSIVSRFSTNDVSSSLQNILKVVISVMPIFLLLSVAFTSYYATRKYRELIEFNKIAEDAIRSRAKIISHKFRDNPLLDSYNDLIEEYNDLKRDL